jgi:hypothetical protein
MATYSHDEVVKAKMSQLANVTTAAAVRITPQILSVAARELLENAGEDEYNAYIIAFNLYSEGTFATFDAKAFDALTDAEKSMRNLIFAEAYFGLYHLALALKKLVKGSVNVARESAGSASIVASAYDDIINNAENYREQALNCIGFASSITDTEEDEELYVDGSLGVFVV